MTITGVDPLKRRFHNTDDLIKWALGLTGEEVIRLSWVGYAESKRLYEYAMRLVKERNIPLTRPVISTIMDITQSGIKQASLRKDNVMSPFKVLPKTIGFETVKFEKTGDSYAGKLLAIRNVTVNGQPASVADFMGDDDKGFSFFLSTVLLRRLTPDMVGLTLKITFLGEVQGENGGRPYKDYEIAVWTDDTEDDIPF